MELTINGCKVHLSMTLLENGAFRPVRDEDPVSLELSEMPGWTEYRLELHSETETQVRLELVPAEGGPCFPVIPCCILGDNNAALVHEGEFPVLTQDTKGDPFRSPFWEFRADRAAMPLSALCLSSGTLAVSVEPYSQTEHGWIHNGVFASLPDACGVSLGYTNDPVSFINKRTPGPKTGESACHAVTTGRIYFEAAKEGEPPRLSIHRIIRKEYALRHERPVFHRSFRDAVEGCLTSFSTISWDPEAKEYTNCNCLPPADTKLKPWRLVKEIGWTGGGVLAYPLVLSEDVLGEKAARIRGAARSGEEMFDQIASGYNESSGLLYDLTSPIDETGSMVNGWWSGFGLTKDVHCAYTVGSAVHYMLKTLVYLIDQKRALPQAWLFAAKRTIDTAIELQREDGAFGYTFRTDRKEVADWEGFAGCWFVPCCAYLYHLTGEEKYLAAADRGLSYYGQSVDTLTCCATPMDTWKSPDEEGNLAYIRGARLLHEYTGEEKYLRALERGAAFEFLWRYGYRTRPDNRPLIDGWNACGGSITSVSNPHIHPMGMIVDSDLYYLGKVTGDSYYTDRAKDGTAWLMQTLELYPDKTGYGRYGVLSERWCPSDGLVIQRDSEGKPYSSWFSFNLWAGAAAFEEVCERALDQEKAGKSC